MSELLRKDENNQREIRRAFENEITELRALLTAVEQASAETELRHLNSVSELVKEKELLQEEVQNLKEACKLLNHSVREAQTEQSKMRSELEESQQQNKEARIKNEEIELQAASFRAERDEIQKKLAVLHKEMEEVVTLREKDLLDHLQIVEQVKRKCDSSWRLREDVSKEKRASLCRKIQHLRKKLKDAHNQIAKLSFESNQLLIQRRECEAQLCAMKNLRLVSKVFQQDFNNARMQQAQVDHSVSLSSAMEQSMNKAKVIDAELNQLAARQSRYLPNRM